MDDQMINATDTELALADSTLVRDAGLDGYRALAAHALLAGFRALRRITSYGIKFEDLTPAIIIDFLKDEEAAARKHGRRQRHNPDTSSAACRRLAEGGTVQ